MDCGLNSHWWLLVRLNAHCPEPASTIWRGKSFLSREVQARRALMPHAHSPTLPKTSYWCDPKYVIISVMYQQILSCVQWLFEAIRTGWIQYIAIKSQYSEGRVADFHVQEIRSNGGIYMKSCCVWYFLSFYSSVSQRTPVSRWYFTCLHHELV